MPARRVARRKHSLSRASAQAICERAGRLHVGIATTSIFRQRPLKELRFFRGNPAESQSSCILAFIIPEWRWLRRLVRRCSFLSLTFKPRFYRGFSFFWTTCYGPAALLDTTSCTLNLRFGILYTNIALTRCHVRPGETWRPASPRVQPTKASLRQRHYASPGFAFAAWQDNSVRFQPDEDNGDTLDTLSASR